MYRAEVQFPSLYQCRWGADRAYSFCPDAWQARNSRWGEPVGDFVKAVKAHAELRCTVGVRSSEEKLDEEMYAKMTFWVCAYASNSLCRARGNGTCSCVGAEYSEAAAGVVLELNGS